MRPRLHRPGLLLALLLPVATACARTDPALVQLQEDRRAIARTLDAYGHALATGRVERLDSLLADDAVQLFVNRPPVEGRDAVVRWWRGVVAQRAPGDGPLRARTRVVEIEVAGGRAYAVGSFEELPPGQAAAPGAPEAGGAGDESVGGVYVPGDSAWMRPVPVADTVLGLGPRDLGRFKFLAILVREPPPGDGWRILRHSLTPDGRYRLP